MPRPSEGRCSRTNVTLHKARAWTCTTRQTSCDSESGDGFCDGKRGLQSSLSKLSLHPTGWRQDLQRAGSLRSRRARRSGFPQAKCNCLEQDKTDFVYLHKEASIVPLGLFADENCLGHAWKGKDGEGTTRNHELRFLSNTLSSLKAKRNN